MAAESRQGNGRSEPWLEIVVPARNEAARLPAGLAALIAKARTLPAGVEILVVDNASTDDTAEIVRNWPEGPIPVRLLSCERLGKGAAVRLGLLATRAPYVGFCDADMATDLSALDVATDLLRGGASMVLGSRSHPDSVVEDRHSYLRRLGAAAFRGLARISAPGVRDTQCGFKFFSGPIARSAAESLRATGFSFDIELIARCRRQGARPIEIPVTWYDRPGSTFSVWAHSGGAFWEVGVISLTLFLSWLAGLMASLTRRQPTSAGSLPDRQPSPAPGLAGRSIALVNWRDPWHPDHGGAERYAWEIALGLQRRGARLRFVTARGRGQSRRDSRDGIAIERLGGRWTVYPRVLAWLLLRRRSFDTVIDCQNGIPFFTPLVLPRRVQVICVVHHVHDAQFSVHFPPAVAAVGRLLEGPFARWCYRRDSCVAVSESTVHAMRARLGWTGPITIVPNGLHAEPASAPGQPDERAAVASESSSLSFVGRLVAHKRPGLLLDVAERIAGAGMTIDVIGAGPELGWLAKQTAARGLENVVRLHGYLPEEAKHDLVGRSILHLNTSQGEGWGLCVLEAAALGVPTVAYNVDGLRDAVRHGETGWLVGDSERIEDVVERALKELADPVRRRMVAAACRAWAANFDWDRSAQMMAELIAGPSTTVVAESLGYSSDRGQRTR